jgi:hypothetical protein
MESSIKRVLKSRQIGLVQTFHLISGTAGTPADSGADSMFVESIDDLGVGSWKVNFKGKSLRDIALAGIVPVTAGVIINIAAVDKESITFNCVTHANVAADADFYFSCIHATTVEAKF